MSAAATEQKVATPPAKKVYFARREELVLTKRKDTPVRDESGQVVDITPGQRIAFFDGKLTVPLSGTYLGPRNEEIDAAEVIDWLEGNESKGIRPHPLFGDKGEGFWLHEEAAPAPSEAEQTELVRLAEERDVSGIEELIAQEESGWNREEFVKVARGTLERVKAREDSQETPGATPQTTKSQDVGDGS